MEISESSLRLLQSIIPSVITAIITIVGFIITYRRTKKTFLEEVQKQKHNIYLAKVEKLPLQILELMNDIIDKKDTASCIEQYKAIMAQLFAYGSKDAIKLTVSMQEFFYKLNGRQDETWKTIAFNILLICQIKYDLTGIEVSPQYWYKMRLTDYAKMRSALDKSNNEIVDDLELKSFLKVHAD